MATSKPEPGTTLDALIRMTADKGEIPSTPKSLPNDVNEGKRLPPGFSDFALKVIAAYARQIGDALNLYLPLPAMERFHASHAHIRLVSGSNQSGKTFAAAVEFARIFRGMDPHHKRAPKDLRMLMVGLDEDHLGQVMWNKLYFPGSFTIVPDEHDGFWRAVRPNRHDPLHIDPIDEARRELWQPAPPLIPAEAIVKLSYSKASEAIPSFISGPNGSECLCHTSRGAPRQGIQLDYAWMDEQLINRKWVPELIGPRLVKRNGIAVWSATPEDQTPQFYELLKRAWGGDNDVADFALLVADNPYYSDEAKRILYNDLAAQGDDILQAKWFGKPSIAGLAVYPTYDQRVQGVVQFDVPDDWMRVAAIDPGTQFAAALFGAVPPSGDEIHIFDELLVRGQDAAEFARQFRRKLDGYAYEVYLIDKKGSDQRPMGRANTTFDHYTQEFKRNRVAPSRLTGEFFQYGSTEVQARELSVKRRLADGTLKFHIGRTYNLDQQIPRRFYRKDNPNKREKQKGIDLVDCYDAQTEVLTDAGWCPFASLTGQERLATVNLHNDRLEYQRPARIIAKPYSGEMIHFGGDFRQAIDLLVTPTHRMVVFRQGSEIPEIVMASEVRKTHTLKASCTWDAEYSEDASLSVPFNASVKPSKIDSLDWAAFLGWFVAEGSYAKTPKCPGAGYAVTVSQNDGEKCEALRSVLARTPWKWHRAGNNFQASSKQLWNIVSALGKGADRTIPDWIRWQSPLVIARFLECAVAGDGWISPSGRRIYATISKSLADGMQELFIKSGRFASIVTRPPKQWLIRGASGQSRMQYWVSEWRHPRRGFNSRAADSDVFKRVHYDGMVYCATVPNGTLLVRRNGKPLVGGNCLEYLVAYFDRGITYHPPHRARDTETDYEAKLHEYFASKHERSAESQRRHAVRGSYPGYRSW